MTEYSNNIRNILFVLAVLIILYGAYKALFVTNEGLTIQQKELKKKICKKGKKKSKKCVLLKCGIKNLKAKKTQFAVIKQGRRFRCKKFCKGNTQFMLNSKSKKGYKCVK